MKVIISLLLVGLSHSISSVSIKAALPETEWYESTIFYQIYPRSFMDSDYKMDGVGDLKGITSKLDHLKESGIGATWLSPIFSSPMLDFGYDISDFQNVAEIFGTMDDLVALFTKAQSLDIKIILDFVPNHSSDQHKWFIASSDPTHADYEKYKNYYVWKDAKMVNNERKPPNNWNSVFYGSAWTWVEARQQYYLHQFDKSQPDLNYREIVVREAMKDVLRFWLDLGADGFRVDAINHLYEVESFIDEPINDPSDELGYGYTHKHYTKDLYDTYLEIYSWRDLLDEYKAKDGKTRIMMTEAYTNATGVLLYYGSTDGTRIGSHMPFNFVLIENLNEDSNAVDFKKVIDDWLHLLDGKKSNWVLGNHDKSRVGTRYGAELVDGMNALLMTLPGIAVTYNGDEIGMVDHPSIDYAHTQDPQACNFKNESYLFMSRDPQRSPFQWDDTTYAGFSKTSNVDGTWIDVNPNYKTLNLAAQKLAARSHYKFYKALAELRKKNTFIHGDYKSITFGNNILAYSRTLADHDNYIVIINLGSIAQEIDLTQLQANIPDATKIALAGSTSTHGDGDEINSKQLQVGRYDTLIIQYSSAGTLQLSFLLVLVAALFKWIQ